MAKKKIIKTVTTTTEEIIENGDEKTLIVCILDRSGSMSVAIVSAIEKFNEFLNKQQLLPDKADMTIALFDDQYELLYDNVNIKNVKPLTRDQWSPRGMTRLNDAIGKTINTVKRDIEKMDKKDRPDKILVVITTDGYENDSKDYTYDQVKKLIKDYENEKWAFLYLAANQDAFAIGTLKYGFAAGNTFSFANTTVGNAVLYSTLSSSATLYRGMSANSASFKTRKQSLINNDDDQTSGNAISTSNSNNANSGLNIIGNAATANVKTITKTEVTEEEK